MEIVIFTTSFIQCIQLLDYPILFRYTQPTNVAVKQHTSPDIYFREATSDPDPRQHSWNLTAGKQHRGHLGQAGRCRESSDVDLEGSQLWLPWLHEDHQLRGPGRHLQRLHRHARLLRGEVGQPDPEDRSQHPSREHRPAQCQRGRLPASLVPLVSQSCHHE